MQEACRQNKDQTKSHICLLTCAWLWHMLLGIIYGKLCPELLILFECNFHGTIYFFHWWTGASRKDPFETIWRNKKVFMWLDLEQFQRRYWYFRRPKRHTCSEHIKRSRNWAFIELFSSANAREVKSTVFSSHLRLQTIRQPRQATSHDACHVSSTCRKRDVEKTLYNQTRVLVEQGHISVKVWFVLDRQQAAGTISYCPPLKRGKTLKMLSSVCLHAFG